MKHDKDRYHHQYALWTDIIDGLSETSMLALYDAVVKHLHVKRHILRTRREALDALEQNLLAAAAEDRWMTPEELAEFESREAARNGITTVDQGVEVLGAMIAKAEGLA